VANVEAFPPQQSASRLRAKHPTQTVFLNKSSNHLSRAGSMFIYKNDHSPVERLWPQPLGDNGNREISAKKTKGKEG